MLSAVFYEIFKDTALCIKKAKAQRYNFMVVIHISKETKTQVRQVMESLAA